MFKIVPMPPQAEIEWTVGDVIVKLRRAKPWTQAELADRAGVAPATVMRIELDQSDTKQETLAAIAGAFKLSIRDLFALIPGGKQAPPAPPRQRDLVDAFEQLDEEDQHDLRRLIKRWAGRMSPLVEHIQARKVRHMGA